jgi:hypothetical protein
MNERPSESNIRSAHAQAVGGKPKRCSKGKSCSAACIVRSDICLVEIPVSPAAALSQFKDKIGNSISAQPSSLSVDTGELKKHVKDTDIKIKTGIKKAISNNDEASYNKHRDEAIEFNKSLVRKNLTDKAPPIRVPVSWEKFTTVRGNYNKAIDSLEESMRKAAQEGKRDEYDKLERRLLAVQEKIGSRVGATEARKRNEIWESEQKNRSEDSIVSSLVSRLKSDERLKDHYFDESYPKSILEIDRQVGDHTITAELYNIGKKEMQMSFRVDGEYSRDPYMSDSDARKIAFKTKSMFDAILSHLEDGKIIRVSPDDGDGYGEAREKAYIAYGFVSGGGEYMYGMVKNGKIVAPPDM